MAAEITIGALTDAGALPARWAALHDRAEAGIFQSWDWLGCRFAARFTRPVLLAARRDGRDVALGLFNARGGRLWLGETGDPREDSVFTEHNGLLLDRAEGPDLLRSCLRAALAAGVGALRLRGGLVLGGVSDATLAAAGAAGTVAVTRSRAAPFVDLDAVRAGGGDYLAQVSANTRQRLRRSARLYGAHGELRVRRAAGAAERLAFLDALAALHQATWTRRGLPGAFAEPAFVRFHRDLAGADGADRFVDLLRIAAGDRVIGYLYNLRHRGRVANYQSGFDYPEADNRLTPGLTCHHLAIERALADGMAAYDFLAGDSRYKTSLATGGTELHWAVAAPAASLPGLALRAKPYLRALRQRLLR